MRRLRSLATRNKKLHVIFTKCEQQVIYLWSGHHGEFGISANHSFLQVQQILVMELWMSLSQTAGILPGPLGRMNAMLATAIESEIWVRILNGIKLVIVKRWGRAERSKWGGTKEAGMEDNTQFSHMAELGQREERKDGGNEKNDRGKSSKKKRCRFSEDRRGWKDKNLTIFPGRVEC